MTRAQRINARQDKIWEQCKAEIARTYITPEEYEAAHKIWKKILFAKAQILNAESLSGKLAWKTEIKRLTKLRRYILKAQEHDLLDLTAK
jgi:hypothetical protein